MNKIGKKIRVIYQSVDRGARPPQIWPHLPVLVLCSLLRYAAPAIQSNPSRRCRNAIREQDFLLLKMKEYDA